jgi:enoyl-CoA hydratase/carnithine racemase
MKLGFLPQPSDPGRLVALVGPAHAKMILMAGQKIDAELAHQWGLVDRISDSETLIETAYDLGADALIAAPDHIAAIKRLTT